MTDWKTLTTAVVKNSVLFKALKIDIFIEWANKSNYTNGHILYFQDTLSPSFTICGKTWSCPATRNN